MKKFLWALLLSLISAPIGFAQSTTPVASGQVNVTDGSGGYTLQPYGSGSLPTGFTANTGTGVFTVPNGYAVSNPTQGVIVLQQNATAAAAQPANSYELMAPQSGLTSSYFNVVPLVAPTLSNSVIVSPVGGGQETWVGLGQVRIATATLGTAVNTLTFSSIPQTFSHLRIELYGQDAASVNGIFVQFNADSTAAHYSYTTTVNNAGTIIGSNTSTSSNGVLVGALPATGVGSAVIDIVGYTSTTFNKGVLAANQITDPSGGNAYYQNIVGAWNVASAITSVTINCSGTNFTIGTTFSLYGLP